MVAVELLPGAELDLLIDCADAEFPRMVARAAPALLTGNGGQLGRLLPRLRSVATARRPWAGLVLAMALHDCDPGDLRATALAQRCRATFERRQDRRGLGFALCTLGNMAISRGAIDEAVPLWEAGRGLLGPESAAYTQALANCSLGAYARGDLRGALAIAQEAVAVSVAGGLCRAHGMARVYAAAFSLWTGDFTRAARSIAGAREAFLAVPDPAERYEWPLVDALDGVLAALRGDRDRAEHLFAAALRAADQVGAEWIRAIVLVLRADHCAGWTPARSLADAQVARSALCRLGDRWWSGAAKLAMGVALAAGGDRAAAVSMFERLLGGDELIALDRARCMLLLGEELLRTGDPHTGAPRAVAVLTGARDRLEAAGARYWAARACAALAAADHPTGARHWARARELAGSGPAAERLFRGTSRLAVTVLGRPSVLVDGIEPRFPTRHARLVIFALAAAGPAGVGAETLQSWLWPDADRAAAMHRLRTALWHARRALGPAGGRLHRAGHRVVLSIGAGECDLTDALADAHRLLTRPASPRHAVAGVLLRLAHPVLGGEEYGDWVTDLQDQVDALRGRLELIAAHPRRPAV